MVPVKPRGQRFTAVQIGADPKTTETLCRRRITLCHASDRTPVDASSASDEAVSRDSTVVCSCVEGSRYQIAPQALDWLPLRVE